MASTPNQLPKGTATRLSLLSPTNRSKWSHPKFWTDLCPHLSIGEPIGHQSADNANNHQHQHARKRRIQLLRERGYALVDESIDTSNSLVQPLVHGIEQLQAVGLPASCILVFDAVWQLALSSKQNILHSDIAASATASSCSKDESHHHHFHGDILAWCITDEGFSPHRDRQPDDENALNASFDAEENAKFVTHWIALTDATPENSCLYVIPKPNDPGYTTGDVDYQDPLQRALPRKESYQHICALPRQAGQSVLFTHRLIHWGSARQQPPPSKASNGDEADTSILPYRMAISFVSCHSSFEEPYLVQHPDLDPANLPFEQRLLLLCSQLLIYYQRFNLAKDEIMACYEYCKQHQDQLGSKYRQRVFYEFVQAMKEQEQQHLTQETSTTATVDGVEKPTTTGKAVASRKAGTDADNPGDNDGGWDDDEEDAVLEEMLNAEEAGYGDQFEDDFDNQNNSNHDDNGGNFEDEEEEEDDDDEEEEEEGTTIDDFLGRKRKGEKGKDNTCDRKDENKKTPASSSKKKRLEASIC